MINAPNYRMQILLPAFDESQWILAHLELWAPDEGSARVQAEVLLKTQTGIVHIEEIKDGSATKEIRKSHTGNHRSRNRARRSKQAHLKSEGGVD